MLRSPVCVCGGGLSFERFVWSRVAVASGCHLSLEFLSLCHVSSQEPKDVNQNVTPGEKVLKCEDASKFTSF